MGIVLVIAGKLFQTSDGNSISGSWETVSNILMGKELVVSDKLFQKSDGYIIIGNW